MHYQQTRATITIRIDDKVYVESIENAEIDGMTIPELDEKYDYRVYEKTQDGSHRRHALVGDHGAICDSGEEVWEPGDEAFNDLDELCKRQIDRLAKEEEDLNKIVTMHQEATWENNKLDAETEYNKPENVQTRAKAEKEDDKALIARLERLGFKRSV